MAPAPLGRTGLNVTPLGFGAFKIGRNQATKYGVEYPLPDEAAAGRLLNAVVDLGVTLIDTAPAYGVSEERIGRHLGARRSEFVLSTKVGEIFENGVSRYDFTARAISDSVEASLRRLRSEAVDLLLLHVPAEDLRVLCESDAESALAGLKKRGLTRCIGLSAKSVEAAERALAWADVLMVEYHLQERGFEGVVSKAAAQGVGVLVKKGLGSGKLPAEKAISFVLGNPAVSSLVVGGLNLEHIRENVRMAEAALTTRAGPPRGRLNGD